MSRDEIVVVDLDNNRYVVAAKIDAIIGWKKGTEFYTEDIEKWIKEHDSLCRK